MHNAVRVAPPVPCFAFKHPSNTHTGAKEREAAAAATTTAAVAVTTTKSNDANREAAPLVTLPPGMRFIDTAAGGVAVDDETREARQTAAMMSIPSGCTSTAASPYDGELAAPRGDNTRYAVLRFSVKVAGVVHGFAGYFASALYDDVVISICPPNASQGMFSWFPIFFPLAHPMQVRSGDEIELHFWRCVSPQRVWYEWAVAAPQASTVHNPLGRSSHIGI
jgi:protein arginine N-methyltransferase 5